MLMEFSVTVNFSECDGKIRETPCCCCSVIRLCLTHYDLMDCRTADFPVLHHLPELVQTHIHWVSDAHPAISFSAIPFSLYLQSFPASGSFPMSQLFLLGGQIWNFSFSISPSNGYSGLISFRIDWFDLLAVQGTLKSLLQYHGSKALILHCSDFFIVQFSYTYMTTAKTIALTRQTFVGKVMSLLFNMLSRFVTAFLPGVSKV